MMTDEIESLIDALNKELLALTAALKASQENIKKLGEIIEAQQARISELEAALEVYPTTQKDNE